MSVFTTDSAPSTRLEDSARGEMISGRSFGSGIGSILVVFGQSVNQLVVDPGRFLRLQWACG